MYDEFSPIMQTNTANTHTASSSDGATAATMECKYYDGTTVKLAPANIDIYVTAYEDCRKMVSLNPHKYLGKTMIIDKDLNAGLNIVAFDIFAIKPDPSYCTYQFELINVATTNTMISSSSVFEFDENLQQLRFLNIQALNTFNGDVKVRVQVKAVDGLG